MQIFSVSSAFCTISRETHCHPVRPKNRTCLKENSLSGGLLTKIKWLYIIDIINSFKFVKKNPLLILVIRNLFTLNLFFLYYNMLNRGNEVFSGTSYTLYIPVFLNFASIYAKPCAITTLQMPPNFYLDCKLLLLTILSTICQQL